MKSHIRAVTLALVVGIALTTAFAGEAAAAPKRPKDNGQRCTLPGATLDPPTSEDWVFFMPGEWISVVDAQGNVRVLECQPDGTWHEVRAPKPAAEGNTATRPTVAAP